MLLHGGVDENMNIIIAADIVPTHSNCKCFVNGNVSDFIDKNILDMLSESSKNISNLECPLTECKNGILKCGPNLKASPDVIEGIKTLGVDAFTLANNHIMDYGVEGLNDTINVLEASGIDYFGVGDDALKASKPYIFNVDERVIGVYACAEHEFSIAGEESPGANPYDPLETFDHISELKRQCDYVIVLYHGGKEYYRYPSPLLQKTCRKMCDKGADLVICQHSHCIGCEEKYNSSTIVYGQGNFIFDAASNEYWDSSLLVSIDFMDEITINYIPLEKKDGFIRISEDKTILENFIARSEEIKNDGFIEKNYSEFADSTIENYINTFSGVGFLFRVINKLCGHRLKKKVKKKRQYAMINYIECESHRELFVNGLKTYKS